ncbi:hypothetical protein CBM2633_B90362 [Cupriavidus taiwanensis]|nr:hypothetical protein CBM2633_B90362 [Cupriavidus taiwanensis]
MQLHHRHVGGFQRRGPLRSGARRHDLRHHAVQLVDMLVALDDGAEARVRIHQVGLADQGQELAPLLVVVEQHAQVAVPGPVRATMLVEDAGVAAGADRRLEGQPAHVVAQDELRHGLEHRHVDRLALAAAFAVEQPCGDGVDRGQADDTVGDRAGRVARHVAAGQLRQRGNRNRALDQVIVGGLGRVRAALPVAVQAYVQDARIHLRDFLVAQVQPRHRLRAHVVDQHVGIGGDAQQRLTPGGGFQVEHHAALAAVGVQEDARHAVVAARADLAHGVAVGRLDLDHVGTEVTQDLGRVRSHQHRRHVDDANALQRAAHGCLRCIGRLAYGVILSSPDCLTPMLRILPPLEKYFMYVDQYTACIGRGQRAASRHRARAIRLAASAAAAPAA